ncbi:MAG: hypothetical protein NO516_05175 [Candidatus Methanomethylicia archaeon]|nr:hypothetical protein [Candidatus Methanomethylicia archaeon]
MKVIQIAGFLGSGKTTTLTAISRKIGSEMRKKTAIIVNEIGAVPVDAKVISEHGLKVIEMGDGCICCEIAANVAWTLKELGEKYKPDIVFIEPSGVALPEQVRGAVELGRKYVEVEIGKVVVLFDALKGEELLGYEDLKDFVMRQIKNADIIALNKVDAVSEVQSEYCEKKLRQLNPDADFIRISAINGDGLDGLINRML